MKKGFAILLTLFFAILIAFPFINSVSAEDTLKNLTESQRINLAYSCLDSKIKDTGCDEISVNDQIFSFLAIGSCYDELIQNSKNDECWPQKSCDVITTAQSVWALDKNNKDVTEPVSWLKNKSMVSKDLIWYLEIETRKESICTISYGEKQTSKKYTITINENKTLSKSNDLGNCLEIDDAGYWLKLDENCYGYNYKINCDEDFLTTLIFKKPGDDNKFYILDQIQQASPGGYTEEKINAYCFSNDGENCDYWGTLWATMALSNMDEIDSSSYIPYLVAMEEEHKRDYFVSPLLYIITADSNYAQSVLNKQISTEGYWSVANSDYFDTALALLSLSGEGEIKERQSAIDWLFGRQKEDGCFGSASIKDMGFLLYSVWPGQYTGWINPNDDTDEVSDNSCTDSGYYCMLSSECPSGQRAIQSEGCAVSEICCKVPKEEKLCTDVGEICSSNQNCIGGTTQRIGFSDVTSYGEFCCVGGTCQNKGAFSEIENSCVDNFGTCDTSCEKGYEQTSDYTCSNSYEICCIESKKGMIPLWIWLLFGVVILIVIGIIYKNQILELFKKKKGKKGSDSGSFSQNGPGYPRYPQRPSGIQPSTVNRQTLPVRQTNLPISKRQFSSQPIKQKSSREMDDILKKLKDISN